MWWNYLASLRRVSSGRPDIQSDKDSLQNSVDKLKKALAAADKPLIWVGVEIDRLGLQDKAEMLIRQLKIPYVTQLFSKAVLSEEDPLFRRRI